ncbi:MAG: SpoIID/LytB domain-containing protein [Puniceicoccales bacterium]|jgi:SpoIID/LytB domain protein|nr:SpoIID/LytB domain-containing protein [Puniceicoccales bacterium]
MIKIKCILLALIAIGLSTRCESSASPDGKYFLRVAISDNQFKEFSYGEIELIATDNYEIYSGQTLLFKVSKSKSTRIKLNRGKFDVYVGSNKQERIAAETLLVKCPNGLLGVKDLQRIGKQALYRGEFELAKAANEKFLLINVVELEDYVKGVVPNEMSAKYGIEALKSQAVAARSYALSPRLGSLEKFNLYDSTLSQSYFGVNTETQATTEATQKTAGLVALSNGNVITAQYTTASCGHTENCENSFSSSDNTFPSAPKSYLRGRPDYQNMGNLKTEAAAKKFYKSRPKSYDEESKFFRWQVEWTASELEESLPKTLQQQSKTGFVRKNSATSSNFGKLKHINVTKRGVSGIIMEMEIVSDSQKFTVKKELVIRRVLTKNGAPLLSANVAFDHLVDKNGNLQKVIAYGGGFGHNVGMSQHGAEFMATRLGKTFDQILKSYYSNIAIGTMPAVISPNAKKKSEIRKFYATERAATLVINGKCGPFAIPIGINGKIIQFKSESTNSNTLKRIDISRHIRAGENYIEFFHTANIPEEKTIEIYVEFF